MFGRMIVEPIVQVEPNADLEAAMTALTKITETVEIVRWIELPAAVLLPPSGGMRRGQDPVRRDEHSMPFARQVRNLGELSRGYVVFGVRHIMPDYDRTHLTLR